MNIKSWKEHKAEMNKDDSKETTNILYGSLFFFIIIVGSQFMAFQ